MDIFKSMIWLIGFCTTKHKNSSDRLSVSVSTNHRCLGVDLEFARKELNWAVNMSSRPETCRVLRTKLPEIEGL